MIPGCAIAAVGLACTQINYGIDEISNPRLSTETIRMSRRARVAAPTIAPPTSEAVA